MLLAGRGWTESGRERGMEGGRAEEMEGIWQEREGERGWVRGDKRERETSMGKGLAVVICGELR